MLKITHLALFMMLWNFATGQDCNSPARLYVLDKSILTMSRVTEERIKSMNKRDSLIMEIYKISYPIIINDTLLLNKLIDLLPKNDSMRLHNFDGIDIRMLIEIDSCEIKTIALSYYGLISINTNRVFKYSIDPIIELLKPYIPQNLGWYTVEKKPKENVV